jgi:hypothetical protein
MPLDIGRSRPFRPQTDDLGSSLTSSVRCNAHRPLHVEAKARPGAFERGDVRHADSVSWRSLAKTQRSVRVGHPYWPSVHPANHDMYSAPIEMMEFAEQFAD